MRYAVRNRYLEKMAQRSARDEMYKIIRAAAQSSQTQTQAVASSSPPSAPSVAYQVVIA